MEIHRFAIEPYYQENEQFVRVLSVVISKYRILKLASCNTKFYSYNEREKNAKLPDTCFAKISLFSVGKVQEVSELTH